MKAQPQYRQNVRKEYMDMDEPIPIMPTAYHYRQIKPLPFSQRHSGKITALVLGGSALFSLYAMYQIHLILCL